MKQPKWASWIEAIGGTAFGFVIAIPTQYFVNWWWALPVHTGDTFAIVGIFTVVSVLRGYVWRRWCVSLGIKRTLSPFMQAVIAERFRQPDQEGFDAANDDALDAGDLARAGAAYALNNCVLPNVSSEVEAFRVWPWSRECWKPTGVRRDLVKAAALIIAEGDKFDRQSKRKPEALAA